ncbi:Integrase catalytic domain-containing protein [Aphis craccivora]|uniref:Integrase catalytic domain-containing protein n=1 Tax=Aphis craccivora TaxID=307492 RepID=A0A6G0ZP66_APHCR|nr:Integrase catalytic domain-containing protein [Aphis craccivora]
MVFTKEDRLSILFNRNRFVICKEKFLKVDDQPQTKITPRDSTEIFQFMWIGLRLMYLCTKIASEKQWSDYVHQNVTEALYAIISYIKQPSIENSQIVHFACTIYSLDIPILYLSYFISPRNSLNGMKNPINKISEVCKLGQSCCIHYIVKIIVSRNCQRRN